MIFFCRTIFRKFLFKKVHQQAWPMALSGIHFHIHMPYGIMRNFQSEQREKRFTHFNTKIKKLRIYWEIRIDDLGSKISLAFTFIFKAFSQKIWSVMIRKHPSCSQWQKLSWKELMHSCFKKTLIFYRKAFSDIL